MPGRSGERSDRTAPTRGEGHRRFPTALNVLVPRFASLHCVAESLADAAPDLAQIADVAGDSDLQVDAAALLDAVDAQAGQLEAVIAHRSCR